MVITEKMIENSKEYIEQLKAIGGVEKRKKDRVYICFSPVTLCGLSGVELYVSFDGKLIIGGRTEDREMEAEEVFQIIRSFSRNYYFSCQTLKWKGDLGDSEAIRIKEMINYKLKELKYAGKRKPL